MAKVAGRDFLLKKNNVTIGGVRVTACAYAGTPIDVTDADDDGITKYLADTMARETLEITVEGLIDDDVLADIAFGTGTAAKFFSDITWTRGNGDVLSGTFILTAYQETGNEQEAGAFTATFVRSGIHVNTGA
jgi:predicted secreted protein